MKISDIKGEKYNRLTVISFSEIRGTHAYWNCVCTCGNKVIVRGNLLRSGKSFSCGCYAKELSSIRLKNYTTSEKHKGKNNPAWKGKDAHVSSKHQWLVKHFIKEKCEHCGENKKPRDWALIKGKKYDHNRENFMSLCRSCHLKYDYTEERKIKAKIILDKYCPKRK